MAAGALTLTGGGEVFMGENANDIIVGSSASAIMTNVGDTIAGGGDLGGGELTLVNGAGGKIEAEGSGAPLIIDTGANTIVNAGLIEAAGVGATIMSPVNNSGVLKADGGNLTVNGAVTGAGRAVVAGGALRFNAGFNQNVAFTGAGGGVLVLAQSQAYAATVSGFSTTGSESLDLGDIAFVAADTPTFSGTTSGGVLTVTDGVHTAHIHLAGNYTTSAFIASSDGHGGTSVTDGPKALHWRSPVSGLFQTASNWTDSLVPGPGNDAILDASGANYTATAAAIQTVAGIQTAANAILSVTGAFAATDGTDGGFNAGRVGIGNGGTFTAGGTLDNPGLITLGASSLRTSLVVAGALTLTGGGEIFMGENANDIIVGSSQSAILTNVGNTIAGGGDLGGGELTLVNAAAGKIESEGTSAPLVVDTGANTIANAGVIEAAGDGATIVSPVNNTGVLKADGGNLTVNGAVTGAGHGIISGGTLRFNAGFNQSVAFEGASGVLYLAQSVNYTGLISGFSTTGAESLDLGDIAFVGAGEATFSGTTSGGVLTVTDGTHAAHIHFSGNYTSSTFIASSDGHGGTVIADSSTASMNSAHRFISAASSFGPAAGGPVLASVATLAVRPFILAASHAQA